MEEAVESDELVVIDRGGEVADWMVAEECEAAEGAEWG